jgi:hypothetical protein
VDTEKRPVWGKPDMDRVSTSYVERHNLSMRTSIRRLTRLTNAFSKTRISLEAAVSLYLCHYNLVRRHGSLRVTPAMAAGVADRFWTVGELLDAQASF